MYVEWNMQMSSDLATNQISLLNSHLNPAHRKYQRFACTIRVGLKYLSTSYPENVKTAWNAFNSYIWAVKVKNLCPAALSTWKIISTIGNPKPYNSWGYFWLRVICECLYFHLLSRKLHSAVSNTDFLLSLLSYSCLKRHLKVTVKATN